jgi:hypothetical protein
MRVTRSHVVATMSTAALLVVGFDYTTYAVTGDSLILGHTNRAGGVTTLHRHGDGAALSLKSSGNRAPSLRVSSRARVPRLNADLLDGRHASELATRAVSFRAGARGDVVPGGGFWSVDVKPGIYEISFRAFVLPDQVTPGSTLDVICGVADLNTIGPNTTVYTADSATYTNQFPTLMSGADTVRIRGGAAPGIVCTTADNSDFTLFKPVRATFTPVNHLSLKAAEPVSLGRARSPRLFPPLNR